MGLETAVVLGIGSLAFSAVGTTNSFVQAGKQRDRQEEADRNAKEALEKAEEKLQVNFFEGRSIQKEPFERARENLLSGGAQALQVAQAGERGASAAANRVVTAQQAGEADIRTAMSREMADIQLMALKEESRLRDARANLNLAEAQGQQMIGADARAAEQAANQAGVDGLISMGQQAMKIPGLYGSGKDAEVDTTAAAQAAAVEQAKQDQAALNQAGLSGMSADQRMLNQAGLSGISQDQTMMNQGGLRMTPDIFENMNFDIPALGENPFNKFSQIKR